MEPYTGQLPKHLSVLTVPLRKDRPEPPGPDWMASKCPECGQDAWERSDALEIMAQFTQLKMMCRECARGGTTVNANRIDLAGLMGKIERQELAQGTERKVASLEVTKHESRLAQVR